MRRRRRRHISIPWGREWCNLFVGINAETSTDIRFGAEIGWWHRARHQFSIFAGYGQGKSIDIDIDSQEITPRRLTLNEIESKFKLMFIAGRFSSICFGNGCLAMGYLQQKHRRRSIQLPLVATEVRKKKQCFAIFGRIYLSLVSFNITQRTIWWHQTAGVAFRNGLWSGRQIPYTSEYTLHPVSVLYFFSWIIICIFLCALLHVFRDSLRRQASTMPTESDTSERNTWSEWKRVKWKSNLLNFQLNEQNEILFTRYIPLHDAFTLQLTLRMIMCVDFFR